MGIRKITSNWKLCSCAAALAAAVGALQSASISHAAVLLNDSFADGNRSSTNLPSDSPVWIGQSAANGSNSVSPGKLSFVLPNNSLKFWTYFTSDNSAPNTSQPHNSVTTLGVGDSLTASTTFTPTGLNSSGTSRLFRMGLFFDPTDARVESDTNSDSGGATNPWADATGYAIQIPIALASGNNPILVEKRTVSGQTSLIGSSAAYTVASNTSSPAYTMSDGNSYTLQAVLTEVSATDMQLVISVLQGSTVLSTRTLQDLGTSIGGTNVAAGGLSGSQSIYTQFDHLMFRNDSNAEVSSLDFTNNFVSFTSAAPVPEPATASLLAIAVGGLAARRKRS